MKKIFLVLLYAYLQLYADCTVQYVYQQNMLMNETGKTDAECAALEAKKTAFAAQYEGTTLSMSSSASATSTLTATTNSSTVTPTATSTVSQSSVNTTGGCGMPASFLNSPSALSFNENTLNKGISNIQQSDFESVAFKEGDVGNFSGFTCPKVSEIKDTSFPQNLTAQDGEKGYSVKITGINFYTGAYTCEYSFLKSKTFYTLNKVNPACAKDASAISNAITKGDINALPNISYSGNYGIYTFSEGQINATTDLKKTYTNLLKGIADISKSESSVAPVDISGSLDSHTNHTSTLPSLFLGILTGDVEFLDNPVIDPSGKIRIKNTTIDFTPAEVTDIESLESKFVSVFKSLDARFWGFYYYLIANISYAFSHIVTMIFGLGTVGIFGYAFMRRSIDRDNASDAKFQFDFKNNFMAAITALIVFSAPIVPADKGIPSGFLYQPSNAPTQAQQQEIMQNATLVQVGIRYIFQLGTYWANLVNDYAMFAYLKFISSSYGYYDASSMKADFKKDVSDFMVRSILLKKEMDFFEKSCGKNYLSYLSKDNTLPNYYGGVDANINYLTNNPLGFDSVDYGTCSALFQKIQKESSDNFVKYKEIVKGYDNISDNLQSFLDSDMKEINSFLSLVININNKLGWTSVALVPSITDILETKKILTFSMKQESANEDITKSVGQMEVKKVDLVKRNELEAGRSEAIKDSIKTDESNDTWRLIKSLFDDAPSVSGYAGTAIGWAAGKVVSSFGYFMFPGFTELYTGIEKTTIPTAIANQVSTGISFIQRLAPVGILTTIMNSISTLDKLEVIKGTNGEDGKTFTVFLITYALSLTLYSMIFSIFAVALITLFTVSKIIFYFIEVIIAIFISTAVMLWGLMFDKNSSTSTIGEFFYKISLLALSPISIVLSIYVFLFAKGAMLWLYRLLAEFILFSSKSAIVGLDSKNEGITNITGIDNIIAGINTYGVYAMGEMLVIFFTIFLAYTIMMNFHDWVLTYFGHRGSSVQHSMNAIALEAKNKVMTKI